MLFREVPHRQAGEHVDGRGPGATRHGADGVHVPSKTMEFPLVSDGVRWVFEGFSEPNVRKTVVFEAVLEARLMRFKPSMALKTPRAKEKARPPPPEKQSAVDTTFGNLATAVVSGRVPLLWAYLGQST